MIGKEKQKKAILLIISFLMIFSIISLLVFSILNTKNSVPQLNYNSQEIKELNSNIKQLYNDADGNTTITSEKYNSSNYISLVFKIDVFDSRYNNHVIFYVSYVVDKKAKIVLSTQDIVNQFGITTETIENKINDKLRDYYNDEIDNGYIDGNQCDFNCYKKTYREIDDLSTIYTLSIENNKLNVYFNLNSSPMISDEKYFNNLKFNPRKIEIS